MQNKDSRNNSDGKANSEKWMKLELALSQANESLRESMSTRRALDTKIYGLIVFSSSLIGLLLTVRPWSFKSPIALTFFVAALGCYIAIVALGLMAYFPTESPTSDARAIMKSINQPYDNLAKWTTEELCEFADENYAVAFTKGRILSVMLVIFLAAATCLTLGTLLN